MRKGTLAVCAAAALAGAPAWAEAETEPDAAALASATVPHGELALAESAAGRVDRATFTTAVVDREPQDTVETLTNDTSRIYYFTEIHDMEGATVTHQWSFNGQVVAEVPFEIGGPRWRLYSSKNMDPMWLGEWTASVTDASGNVLASHSFAYTAADAQQPGAMAAAPGATRAPPASPEPTPVTPASHTTP